VIKSAPYYWIICDGCGANAQEGDYSAWKEVEGAEAEAEASDWTIEGGRHLCPACQPDEDEEDDEDEQPQVVAS
jgi:hypothetical protein